MHKQLSNSTYRVTVHRGAKLGDLLLIGVMVAQSHGCHQIVGVDEIGVRMVADIGRKK